MIGFGVSVAAYGWPGLQNDRTIGLGGLTTEPGSVTFIESGDMITAAPGNNPVTQFWQISTDGPWMTINPDGPAQMVSERSYAPTIGIDGVADGAYIRFVEIDVAGQFSYSPAYCVLPVPVSLSVQPSIVGTLIAGNVLRFDEGAAGPGATARITLLTLDGVDQRGALTADRWDTSGAQAGTIRYQVTWTNSRSEVVSDLITANLEAPVVVPGPAAFALRNNDDGTFTILDLPESQPLKLSDNGNDTFDVEAI